MLDTINFSQINPKEMIAQFPEPNYHISLQKSLPKKKTAIKTERIITMQSE